MAYASKELKAKIAAELKVVAPAGWKYSLAVKNHSAIAMTIASAPVDLIGALADCRNVCNGHIQLNHYYPENFFSGDLLKTFDRIIEALNTDNYDNSDSQSDYFDVGHYVELHLGRWDKPFVCVAK